MKEVTEVQELNSETKVERTEKKEIDKTINHSQASLTELPATNVNDITQSTVSFFGAVVIGIGLTILFKKVKNNE